MASKSRTDVLREATSEALETCGAQLLQSPVLFYATLTDLAPSLKAEMTVLRNVLVRSEDSSLMAILGELGPGSSAGDVKRAAARIERRLVDDYVYDATASRSIARGLAEGVACFHGVKLASEPAATVVTPEVPETPGDGTPGDGTPGDVDLPPITRAQVVTIFGVPARTIKVQVTEDNLRHGWKTTRTLKPQYIDDLGATPKDRTDLPKEQIPIKVPAQSHAGETITIEGKGYYGPEGERGDLVVELVEVKTPPAKAPAKTQVSTSRTTNKPVPAQSGPGCLAVVLTIIGILFVAGVILGILGM